MGAFSDPYYRGAYLALNFYALALWDAWNNWSHAFRFGLLVTQWTINTPTITTMRTVSLGCEVDVELPHCLLCK
jgi:hypothetical protein